MTLTALPRRSVCDADLAARFTRDVIPYRDVLHRGARRLTKSDADAEDLLQETLLRAYHGFGGFREGTNLQAWLFKVLYNKWVSGYRARQSRPVEVGEDAITDRVMAVAAEACGIVSAEAEVLATVVDADIANALASLPAGFADVLYLAIVEGYTYAEISEILAVPIGTVMSRVHRGRQRLRTALAHRAPLGCADDRAAAHVA
jgi:RNA polymerase sigma factor (sigma-70 family)